jgi:hypothetical protein
MFRSILNFIDAPKRETYIHKKESLGIGVKKICKGLNK